MNLLLTVCIQSLKLIIFTYYSQIFVSQDVKKAKKKKKKKKEQIEASDEQNIEDDLEVAHRINRYELGVWIEQKFYS